LALGSNGRVDGRNFGAARFHTPIAEINPHFCAQIGRVGNQEGEYSGFSYSMAEDFLGAKTSEFYIPFCNKGHGHTSRAAIEDCFRSTNHSRPWICSEMYPERILFQEQDQLYSTLVGKYSLPKSM
jgi:hypothetical protein